MEVHSSLTPFISPEVQPFRRFFAKFMLAVPAMITIGVAVQTKTEPEAFEFQLADKEINARFDAYVPVMQATSWISDDVTHVTPEQTRKYAEMWAQGWETGKLKAIPPSRFSESIYDGVSGQIVRTQAAIIFALESQTQKLAKDGRTEQAAANAVLEMRLCQVLRNSDLLLNSVMDVRQRRAMGFIAQLAPKLDAAEREELAKKLSSLKSNPKEIEVLCRRSYSAYLRDFSQSGGDPKFVDRLPALQPLSEPSAQVNPAIAIRQVRESMGDVEHQMPKRPYETLLGHALENEATTQAKLQATIQILQQPTE